MLEKIFLFAGLLIVPVLLHSYGDSTEKRNVTNGNFLCKENGLKDELSEFTVNSHEKFMTAFTEMKNLPFSYTFKNVAFTEQDYENYCWFTFYIKETIYADFSEEEWHMKPLGKYKINSTDHLLFFAEEIADTVIVRILISYKTKSMHREMNYNYACGMSIMKIYPKGTYTSFKFIDNKANALNIYNDTDNKQCDMYVRNEYNYYNMSSYVKITAKSNVPVYSFSQFCGLFPKIDDNWKSEEQIKKLRTKSPNDDFSVFIHKKTSMGNTYLNEPVDFVPRFSPLGYKQINDSLHLLVLTNHKPDYDQCELKLVLLKNFDEIIDARYIPNNTAVRTNISYHNNALAFEVKDKQDMTFNIKLLCDDKKGFLPERKSFDKYFKKQIKLPFIADNRLLDSLGSSVHIPFGRVLEIGGGEFLGLLETKRFYIIVMYIGEEITIYSHSFSANASAYLFHKPDLKFAGEVMLYDYFSDGGVEAGSVLFPDRLYSNNTLDQEELDEKPDEKYLDKYLTNYGFINKDYVLPRKTSDSILLQANLFDDLENIQFPFKFEEIKIDDAKKNISVQNSYYSGIIDSLKFIGEPLEPNVPLCLVKGKVGLSDSTLLVVWQTWKKGTVKYDDGKCPAVLEKAIYNKNTGRFIDHSEISFNKDFSIYNDKQ